MGTEKPPVPKISITDPGGNIGIVGVNWNTQLISLKLSDAYYGPSASGIGFALQYAANKGADVINMSFGITYNHPFVNSSVNYAYGKGCVLVASMGNCWYGCATVEYPAGHDSVIAVGATEWHDDRWFYDTLHASSYGEHIDVVAPG